MDRKNNDDSSERVKVVLTLSAMIVMFYLSIAGIIMAWAMPTKNEEQNNSQRSISSMYSSFVGQPEKEVKE